MKHVRDKFDRYGVLVSSACYNNHIIKWGAYKQHLFPSALERGKVKIKMSVDSVSTCGFSLQYLYVLSC